MSHLLLIDDDSALISKQLRRAFPAPVHHVEVVSSGLAGLERIRTRSPDVVLLDSHLPDHCGLEIYKEIRRCDARIPVIFLTPAISADMAIDAMQQGAYDYLFKPVEQSELQRVLDEALDVARRMDEPAVFSETGPHPDRDGAIVGTCAAMREVYKAIGRVAGQNVPVLITGESGTGKEMVAVAICHHGPPARAAFLALNCAAIPENLLESELFGHERGAFTGADRRRIGKFEQYSGGTIFLDEIGDMPIALQAKILRLVQDQTFERVGGDETIRTDVRLIAATHGDLKALATEGKFRRDLYYRLSVFTIHLPPLRERGDDMQTLVQLYLRRYSRELGRDVREVAGEVLDRFRAYSWPGNIRELQSVLKQALLRASGKVLLPRFLPDLLEEATEAAEPESRFRFPPGATLAELERAAIDQCLVRTGGNRQRAAEILGISPRTLLRRIRQYRSQEAPQPTVAVTRNGPRSDRAVKLALQHGGERRKGGDASDPAPRHVPSRSAPAIHRRSSRSTLMPLARGGGPVAALARPIHEPRSP